MAGRPPKPTQLKVLQGNPGKRPLPENEPEPMRGVSTRPGWLSPEAKREWSRLEPELTRMGLLTEVDRGAFAAYCETWATFVRAAKDVQENGYAYVTDKGNEAYRPAASVMSNMLKTMRQYGNLFGLSPSARSKLSIKPAEDEDEFTQFLRQQLG